MDYYKNEILNSNAPFVCEWAWEWDVFGNRALTANFTKECAPPLYTRIICRLLLGSKWTKINK